MYSFGVIECKSKSGVKMFGQRNDFDKGVFRGAERVACRGRRAGREGSDHGLWRALWLAQFHLRESCHSSCLQHLLAKPGSAKVR